MGLAQARRSGVGLAQARRSSVGLAHNAQAGCNYKLHTPHPCTGVRAKICIGWTTMHVDRARQVARGSSLTNQIARNMWSTS